MITAGYLLLAAVCAARLLGLHPLRGLSTAIPAWWTAYSTWRISRNTRALKPARRANLHGPEPKGTLERWDDDELARELRRRRAGSSQSDVIPF